MSDVNVRSFNPSNNNNSLDAQQQPKKKNKQPKKKKVKIIEPGSKLKQIISNGSTSPECVECVESEENTDPGGCPTQPESAELSKADGSEKDIAETTPEITPEITPETTAETTAETTPETTPDPVADIFPELTDVILDSEEVKISEIVQKDLQVAETAPFVETDTVLAAKEVITDSEAEPDFAVPRAGT